MIWSRSGGSDEGPLLVLLHGLGATAEVWAGVQGAWGGGWLAVDLPGHGRSDWDPPYTFARHADAVRPLLPSGREVVVLGHSMGGVVALELADVASAVVAFGVKVDWPDEHVASARRMAERPVTFYETRDEAVARYLKLAGLVDGETDAGVVETSDGWRVAQDPATFGVGVPDMTGLLARAACPVVLARGEHDPMVAAAPVTLPGLGHNAHVEDPAAVVSLVRAAAARPAS
ncbi:alpha/beta fold hydrolase [Nocardioides caricicola]|uniref:Alpha/beta fold hydrolase n=1 Tax=Nocardioides caricicola TaxID=634770 RepID=A0ABW0MW71_9ACTN